MFEGGDWLLTVRGRLTAPRQLTRAEISAAHREIDQAEGLSRGKRATLRYILLVTEETGLDWNKLARREIRHQTGLTDSGQRSVLRELARQKGLLQARPTEDADGGTGPNEYRLACLETADEKGDETPVKALVAK